VKHTPVFNWQNSCAPQVMPANPPHFWPTRAELGVLAKPMVRASANAVEMAKIFDIERSPFARLSI
jgi:hypothetical protein